MSVLAAWGDYRTVDWFVGHPVERNQTLQWCANNLGLARRAPSCENALQAADLVRVQQLYRPAVPMTPSNASKNYWQWCRSLGAANPCGG